MPRSSLVLIAAAGLVAGGAGSCGSPKSPIRNVLLVSIDTLRADHVGAYGFAKPATPALDALAREGVVFENVISPVPITFPAHVSMLTGTLPPRHGLHDNLGGRLPDSAVTLAELLKGRGLATGAVVSSFVLDSRFNLSQGFDSYDDRFEQEHKINYLSERKGDETARRAVAWLDAHQAEPFFLFVHFYDPHDGYEPPEPFASRFKDDPYSGEVAFADHGVGEIVAALARLGRLDSTLVVVAGDHGEMLGEHGELTHQFFVYQGALRVPLIFRVPGHAEPRRVRQLVGLADVVPTLCGALGIPIPPAVQGEDFSAWLRGESPPVRKRGLYAESFTPARYYGASPLFALVTGERKYIETTRPELYDLEKDPGETVNLLEKERPEAEVLRSELKRLVSAPAPPSESVSLDDASRRRLESLGYLGRNRGEVAFDFGTAKEDPKDLIGFYRSDQRLSDLIEHGRWDEARALGDEMLRRRPGFVDGHIQRAEIAVAQQDAASAIGHYSKALALDPKSDRARGGLARVHLWLAAGLKRQGKLAQAGEAYRRALALDPGLAPAHNGLGGLLGSQRRVTEAIGHFREAVRIDPDYAEARQNLALALRMTGERDEALSHFEAALRLRPDWPAPMSEIAWILATHPDERVRDPARAVGLAERAAELTARRQPVVLDSLAAAYAAAGDFSRASATAQEAAALAASGGAGGLAGEIGKRAELYRRNTPFREARDRSRPAGEVDTATRKPY